MPFSFICFLFISSFIVHWSCLSLFIYPFHCTVSSFFASFSFTLIFYFLSSTLFSSFFSLSPSFILPHYCIIFILFLFSIPLLSPYHQSSLSLSPLQPYLFLSPSPLLLPFCFSFSPLLCYLGSSSLPTSYPWTSSSLLC